MQREICINRLVAANHVPTRALKVVAEAEAEAGITRATMVSTAAAAAAGCATVAAALAAS
jgi:hypothetical protein